MQLDTKLQGSLERWAHGRHDKLLFVFLKESLGEVAGDKMLGEFAAVVVQDMQKRGVRVKTMECDDLDFNDLPKQQTVLFLVATCGQCDIWYGIATFR